MFHSLAKLQTRFFIMSKDKFSTRGPRSFGCVSLVVADGFNPLSMMVSDDWKVSEFRLHTEIHNFHFCSS